VEAASYLAALLVPLPYFGFRFQTSQPARSQSALV